MAAAKHSNTVGAYDAKTRFAELLEIVETGEEITITRHGAPVARLVPVSRKLAPAARRDLIRRWRESSKAIKLGSKLKLRDLIHEGRR